MCKSSYCQIRRFDITEIERIKYLESENKFLEDYVFNKRKIIDKLLENNNKLVDHQSYHVPV